MEELEERLVSEGRGDLFRWLQRLRGTLLAGRWRVLDPIGVGGQGAVYRAVNEDDHEQVMVKLAALPYHQPSRFGRADVRVARARMRREGERLTRFVSCGLPMLREIVVAANPLHEATRCAEITDEEVYVVMESVEGEPVDRAALHHWGPAPLEAARFPAIAGDKMFVDPRGFEVLPRMLGQQLAGVVSLSRVSTPGNVDVRTPSPALEKFLADVIRRVALFEQACEDLGSVYTDIKPAHFVIGSDGPLLLRVLDAGALFEPGVDEAPATSHPYTPKLVEGSPVRALAQGALARMIWQLWTGVAPRAEAFLALERLDSGCAPPWLVALVKTLELGTEASWKDLIATAR